MPGAVWLVGSPWCVGGAQHLLGACSQGTLLPPPTDSGQFLSEAQGMAASRVLDQPKLARVTRAHWSAVTSVCAPVSDSCIDLVLSH